MKGSIFWDIRPVINWKSVESFACGLLHAGSSLSLLFNPEDGGDNSVDFQRNTRNYIPQDGTLQNLTHIGLFRPKSFNKTNMYPFEFTHYEIPQCRLY
jgi:hypothetical protein